MQRLASVLVCFVRPLPAPPSPSLAQSPVRPGLRPPNRSDNVFAAVREPPGKPAALYVTVQFKLARHRRQRRPSPSGRTEDEIVVEEDGQPVAEFELSQPKANALTTVLAMDISGSMESNSKIDEAAGRGRRLPRQARPARRLRPDPVRPPAAREGAAGAATPPDVRRPPRPVAPRRSTRRSRWAAPPTSTPPTEAVEMLRDVPGRRAVAAHDRRRRSQFARDAAPRSSRRRRRQDVPVYTIGVGEPGTNEPVTTVLVLDHSGSMAEPADDNDKVSKIAGAAPGGRRGSWI